MREGQVLWPCLLLLMPLFQLRHLAWTHQEMLPQLLALFLPLAQQQNPQQSCSSPSLLPCPEATPSPRFLLQHSSSFWHPPLQLLQLLAL